MTYRLRMLAFGCAAAALGSALPVAAPHAEETVPGMLRCFENGLETATIGPIFRVWSASGADAAPPPGIDGCHWQPMTRIAMPGSAPPPQAIVSTEADETDAAPETGIGSGASTARAADSPAGPPLAAADGAAHAGSGDVDVVPPVLDRSLRMPVDLAVAASLTAEAIAVETADLAPLPDPLDPTLMAGRPTRPPGLAPREPIVVDLALSLEPITGAGPAASLDARPDADRSATGGELAGAERTAEAASRPNPHPPLPAATRAAPAAPFAAAAPAIGPVEPAALLTWPGDGHRLAAASPFLPALLAAALPATDAGPVEGGPLELGPVELGPVEGGPRIAAASAAGARTLAQPAIAAADLPTAGAEIADNRLAAGGAATRAPAEAADRRMPAERANPHAGIPMPAEGRAPVVLASATAEGHRPNPHPELPEGWGLTPAAAVAVAAEDLPRRGDAAMAGAPAERAAPSITLPGWRLAAPRVMVPRSAAVPPAPPAEPEILVAQAGDGAGDGAGVAVGLGDDGAEAPNKLQTANRVAADAPALPPTDDGLAAVAEVPSETGAETGIVTGVETGTDTQAGADRERIAVARAEALAPATVQPGSSPAASVRRGARPDGSAAEAVGHDAAIAAVAAVTPPAAVPAAGPAAGPAAVPAAGPAAGPAALATADPAAPVAAARGGDGAATLAAAASTTPAASPAETPPAPPSAARQAASSAIAPSAPAQTAAAPVLQPAAAPAPATGRVPDGWWLQLASLDSPERALWEWNRRTEAAGGRLDGHAPTVVRAEIEGRGTFFRLWIGPFADRAEAGRLCARIEGPREPCFVHRMDGQIVAVEVASR